MSKIKTNNFDQAKKEMEAMDATLVSKIPSEIDAKDSKHYHVAMVKIMDRPGEVKNDVSINVQAFHQRGFEKIKESFRFLGYSKITVVHDPSKKATPVKQIPTAPAKEPKTANAKSDDLSDENPNDPEFIETANDVVANGTVSDLDAFAHDHTVSDYPTSGNKTDKQKAIKAWLKLEV